MTARLMVVALDAVLLAGLATVMFLSLLYQPDWVWMASGVAMLVALVALAVLPADRRRTATVLIHAAPGAYSLPWTLTIVIWSLRPDPTHGGFVVDSSPDRATATKLLVALLVLHVLGAMLLRGHRHLALLFRKGSTARW